ncbi:pseudouridine kinase [Natronincola peptidivorans]|uniref:Tagatose-6-phosphate kinase n=1 Tax=Natronincola peptidivorans TaxID=426128 RepID=A0A1H9ZZC6_9FIRM|nr:carbohydrate kinase family protein [Natronincola peptidivorans]SES87193.1 pseudouridine kinase [Natronincola peptidivorans]
MDPYIKQKNEVDYVCVVGGANIDIIGKCQNPMVGADSNPGEIQLSLGGVGRNVAHNLYNLGANPYLITAIGKDIYGEKLLKECKEIGINLEHSLVLDEKSGIYLAILDDQGEMITAISQMDIFKRLDTEFLHKKKSIINRAKVIVVDTNISEEAICFLIALTKEKSIPLFLDTVSIAKAAKVKPYIEAFHTIKPNLMELQFLTDRKISNTEDMKAAAAILLRKGVKEVVVSLGEAGAFYHNGESYGRMKGFDIKVKNTTGGGDAFLAGLVYGTLQRISLKEKVILALACGALTVGSYATVNNQISEESLMEFISNQEKSKEE